MTRYTLTFGLALLSLSLAGCKDTRRSGGGVDAGPVAADSGPALDAFVPGSDAGGGNGDSMAQIRIAGGGATGRLEILHEGQWGTICDDSFDATDALVACRQLGYTGGELATTEPGVDPTWMDDVSCTGTELYLASCAFPGWGVHNCSHTEDVGVNCFF